MKLFKLFLNSNKSIKKCVLVTSFLVLPFIVFSQVRIGAVDASKTYDDGTRISYLTLEGVLCEDLSEIIVRDIESHPDVLKFSFYNKSNLMQCMLKSTISFDEHVIEGIINNVIAARFGRVEGSKDFKNRGILNEYNISRFSLDIVDNDLVSKIITEFKESGFISDVNYNGNYFFEVYSLGVIFPEQIESLLQKWGVIIQSESLK